MIRVGDRGRAVTDMRPTGAVEVHGRRLDAKAERLQCVTAGTAIVVVGGDAFGPIVRDAAHVPAPHTLQGYGEPIPLTLDQQIQHQADEHHRRHEELIQPIWENKLMWGTAAGVAAAFGGVGWWLAADVGCVIGVILGFVSVPTVAVIAGLLSEG